MAEAREIATEIDALAVHCRMPIMAVEQRAVWVRDWCSDLAEFDIEAIRAAFREWRHSAQTKFPTPGQMLPILRRQAEARQPRPQASQAWRPLSDDEYAALSLYDKIRHHLILANEALNKAGPMWRNGGPADIGQMPASWHEWRGRAEHHRDEASRLRQIMKRQDLSA